MRLEDEIAGRLISVLGDIQLDTDQGRAVNWGRRRSEIEAALIELRHALTPHGDPVFVQVPADRKPYQILLLAVEHWRRRGCVVRVDAAEWKIVASACDLCGERILENAGRVVA